MDMRSRLYRFMQQLLHWNMYGRLYRRVLELYWNVHRKLQYRLHRKLHRNMHCQLPQAWCAAWVRAKPSLSASAPRVLDLCTGSGALAVTIAAQRPDARVVACDISEEALCVARENAAGLNV